MIYLQFSELNLLKRYGRYCVLLVLFFVATTTNCRAQYILGATGQLMIPTAEMQETGTFMGSVNFLPQELTPGLFRYSTINYSVNMTLFSFVELGYRMTLLKNYVINSHNRLNNQDRSSTIRFCLLKENRYLPSVVVGGDDLFTQGATPYWESYYGVITKSLDFCKGHRLVATVGCFVPKDNKYTFRKGVFGGIRYSPAFCKELKVMAEYDTQGWNVGGAMRFWKHLSVDVFTREFKCVSAGLRYECTLIH